jgi:hypothetical protein
MVFLGKLPGCLRRITIAQSVLAIQNARLFREIEDSPLKRDNGLFSDAAPPERCADL